MLDEDRTDLDGQALRRGLCFTSDGDGLVVVPEPLGDFRVLGIADGWFGRTTEYRSGNPMELLLVRDEVLPVRVADADEHGVEGIPVRLVSRAESGSGWVHEIAVSGGDGVALLHPRRTHARGEWSVSLAIEDPEPVELAIDPRSPPREPLVLRLPEHGSVEVVVTDSEGRPDASTETAWLEFENEAKSAVGALEPRVLRKRELHDGRTTFEHVRADVLFAVKGPRLTSSLVHVRPGERRAVALVNRQAGPGVVVRVLEAPGVPLADTLVRVRNLDDPLAWQTGRLERTAADGRLPLSFSDQAIGRTFALELACADRFRPPLSARLELTPHAGANDLGDLLLLPTRVLVSGFVVDEGGAPIAGADVQCGIPSAQLGGEPEWRSDLTAVSDAAGAFAIHADVGQVPLSLSVTRTGYASRRDVSVSAGASDVRVVLAPHARIVGRVLVNDLADRMSLQVVARSDRDGRLYVGTLLSGDMGFEIPALPAGDYTVWIRWRPGAEDLTLRRIPVRVAAGATVSDPTLDPLDLREELHDVELELIPPMGSKLTEALLQVRDARRGEDGASYSTRVYGPATVHELRVPWSVVDIEVRVPGLRVETARSVHAKERVVLEPGIAILLRLSPEDAAALEQAGASLEIALQAANEGDTVRERRYVPWQPRAGAALAMPEPGTYRAVARVTRQRPGLLPLTETYLLDSVLVDESRVGTPVELSLPAEAREFLGRQ
jgi:hypothetical protein